ncbi:MAG: UvrD-helicase domain-containing protein [Planctomycetaceae bacterium]|nr:UvrD-helicase domain-containing protein [Planctomycetaceae bacterium]
MYELIRASAGSGKTFQLSGHFLRQLFEGWAPETILATTFTRKAAGEILGRVLQRLALAAHDAAECERLAGFLKPAVVTQERASELLAETTAQLHRMRVCTLDSFFQQLARSLTLELGLPPGWSIIDEHVQRKLRQQAIDAVLAQQMPKDAQRLMQMLAKGRSKRSVRDLIDDTVHQFHDLYLLTDEEAWLKIPRPARLTRKEIDAAIREISATTPYDDKRIVKAVREDVERARAGLWDKFISGGLAKKVFAGEHTYYKKPIPGDLVAAYEQLLVHAKAELLTIVAQQTKATYDLIDRFDREYSRLRAEHGWMGFNDVTRRLAHAEGVADGRQISFRLDSSLRHLLLDEFQDTSPDQWQILRRLALSIAANPEGTSFFCVGDPKQAIYGWRGGVAEILDAVEDTMPEIAARSLDQSRRSSQPVIETVNRVFTHINEHDNLRDYGPACHSWQQEFPQHSTVHSDMPGYAEFRTSPHFEGERAEDRRVPYFRWVAEQIRDMHQRTPGAEIGVLTRKNHTVARLVHELRILGVPASEEGGTAPVDSPAVLALMSLLHLASHPGCEVSRFHVASSPFGDVVGLTSWSNSGQAMQVAHELRQRLVDDGYGRTLQWLAAGVAAFCSQRDTLRLQQIVAEGWQYDKAPSLNPAEFVQLLENSRLNRAESAPVRVMTVHQSKGLEFDIVILPELDAPLFRAPSAAAGTPSPGESPDTVCVWRNRAIRSLLPQPLQAAFEQTVARDVSEALCLLYVALTRAAHALHMWTPPISSRSTPASFAGVLLASLPDEKTAPANKLLFQTGDPNWHDAVPRTQSGTPQTIAAPMPPQVRLPVMPERRRGLRREAPSRHESTRLDLPFHELIPGRSAEPVTGISPRLRGTVIHAWFELIDWLEPGWQCDSERCRAAVDELLLPEAERHTLQQEFEGMLSRPNTRRSLSEADVMSLPEFQPYSADLLNEAAHLEVHQERPFVLKRDGAIVVGTIDRLVLLVRNGTPVAADVLDFKTDRFHGDRSEWIAEKVDHYGSQLDEYRSAVKSCFGIPAGSISTRLLLLEADVVVSSQRTTASRLAS